MPSPLQLSEPVPASYRKPDSPADQSLAVIMAMRMAVRMGMPRRVVMVVMIVIGLRHAARP